MSAVSFSLERPGREELERLWRDLEGRADINFFLSWHWIGAWIEEAGLPELVLVGRAQGEIVCLGLLRRALQRRHGFVRSRTFCLHETGDDAKDIIFIEYNGFLADRRFAPLNAEAVSWLRRHVKAAGGFDEIQIGGLIEEEQARLEAAGHRVHVHARKGTAFVDLAAIRESGGGYLATLSSNTRYQIRRALKIYEARGPLELHAAGSIEEAKDFFDRMGELHENAWRGRGASGGAWRYPFLVDFHKRVIDTAFPEGGIEIVRVSCGGVPVGYMHFLVRDGWIGSYLSGFAYEEDNKVKPGLVSFYLYIEEKLKNGGDLLDFLAGDHRYKTSLGQPGPNLVWLHVQEPRAQFALEHGLRKVKQRIEKLRKSRAD